VTSKENSTAAEAEGGDLVKAGAALLPSRKRADAEQKIAAAEAALKRADATLAQKLGFQLCHCTYPLQIMLWHKHEKVTKCPRAECGRRIKDFHRPLPHSDVSY